MLTFVPKRRKKESMSKGKLAKFADMERFENVFQYPYSVVDDVPFDMDCQQIGIAHTVVRHLFR